MSKQVLLTDEDSVIKTKIGSSASLKWTFGREKQLKLIKISDMLRLYEKSYDKREIA